MTDMAAVILMTNRIKELEQKLESVKKKIDEFMVDPDPAKAYDLLGKLQDMLEE